MTSGANAASYAASERESPWFRATTRNHGAYKSSVVIPSEVNKFVWSLTECVMARLGIRCGPVRTCNVLCLWPRVGRPSVEMLPSGASAKILRYTVKVVNKSPCSTFSGLRNESKMDPQPSSFFMGLVLLIFFLVHSALMVNTEQTSCMLHFTAKCLNFPAEVSTDKSHETFQRSVLQANLIFHQNFHLLPRLLN